MVIWLSLIVLLAAVVGGLAYAIVRGLQLWRNLKRTGGLFSDETARISRATAQIEVQLSRAGASSARLADAAERLRGSRARLDVQLGAVTEARLAVKRMLWFLPGV